MVHHGPRMVSHLNSRAIIVFAAALAAFPIGLPAQTTPVRSDSHESRLEILALTQTLNAGILASRSATATLEKWCGDHEMAEVPRIVARLIEGPPRRPTGEQLQRLGVTDESEVRHRHVQLRCGTHVFSEADNWYVPARLTPEMNHLLETTDVSFGTAVLSLKPYRRTLAVNLLWSPLPPGWERQRVPRTFRRSRTLAIPKELFEHRAILYTADHVPFSEVHEVYQATILQFARQ